MIGRRIGRLTVIKRGPNKPTGQKRWRCKCDCGKTKVIDAHSLIRKNQTRSCGCLSAELSAKRLTGNKAKLRHGHSLTGRVTSEYRTWQNIRRRCYRPTDKWYHNYGGRGIQVCSRWFKFENFLTDMGRKPSPRHSIDRVDNDGNYEPSNCRWATPEEQTLNQRPRKRIEEFSTEELQNELSRRPVVQPA